MVLMRTSALPGKYKQEQLPAYSAICGITDTELVTCMAEDIRQMKHFRTDTTYVFELKVNGTAQEALDQINGKGYALPYETEGRRVVKVGVQYFD